MIRTNFPSANPRNLTGSRLRNECYYVHFSWRPATAKNISVMVDELQIETNPPRLISDASEALVKKVSEQLIVFKQSVPLGST